MTELAPAARRSTAWILASLGVAGAALPADASVYVLSTLAEIVPAQRHTIAHPLPVQLLTEFQTNGATNPKATQVTAPMVADEVKKSGLFSAVSDAPVAAGGRLSVVLNDIPDKGAAGKGFTAGLTLGLAGVLAGDTYQVTLTYTPSGGGAPVTRTMPYRIMFKFGNKELPAGAMKVKNLDDAVRSMVHLTVTHGLDEMAADPALDPSGAQGSPQRPSPTAGQP